MNHKQANLRVRRGLVGEILTKQIKKSITYRRDEGKLPRLDIEGERVDFPEER